jgi:large-conductance mechanosensitive channel
MRAMVVAGKSSFASRFGTALRRLLWVLFLAFRGIFAILGVAAVVYLLVAWIVGVQLSFSDVQKFFDPEQEPPKLLKRGWQLGKTVVQVVSFFLVAIALFLAAVRMKTVARIISDFLLARGPIYTLSGTITTVAEIVDKLASLVPTIQLLSEKSDALQKQVADLQRFQSSERTEPGGDGAQPAVGAPGAVVPPQPAADDSGNWPKLQELWYANTARLEGIIDRISDGRKKLKYNKMPRTNYTRIINALVRDKLISEAAGKASLELNNTFKSYQPRNRTVSDSVIGDLAVLDAQLGHEIGAPPPDDDEDSPQPPIEKPVP